MVAQEWEYMFVTIRYNQAGQAPSQATFQVNNAPAGTTAQSAVEFFNELGKQHWELTAADNVNSYVFKRPIE